MTNLIQQDRLPQDPGLTIIGAGFEDAQRQRIQMIAEEMDARLNSAHVEIERDIFNRFCERLLPVTFRDWMCKP